MNLDKLNAELLQCRRCTRLVDWRERVAGQKRRAYREQAYWGKPVPGFGDAQARVLVVGLAPGAHGSNRTGRMFTGDTSGDFLYPALHRAGFASQPEAVARGDGLSLSDLYISAVCRCAPPDNKPTRQEQINCQPYLEMEIRLIQPRVLVALGRIAFEGILRTLAHAGADGSATGARKFGHNTGFPLGDGRWIWTSYHPSRQNTQTGRLTTEMFDEVWQSVRQLLGR